LSDTFLAKQMGISTSSISLQVFTCKGVRRRRRRPTNGLRANAYDQSAEIGNSRD
ncbi:MAG: hypothetical protein EZS28_041789, partial [Streblomastix strix]